MATSKPSPATGERREPTRTDQTDAQRAPKSLRRFARATRPGPAPGTQRLRRDW